MTLKNLDILALRSFVLIADGLSFAQAGEAVGRSQSAISLQMQRLERDLGAPLLRRAGRQQMGRHVGLTVAGGLLLPLARDLIGANDAALSSMGSGGPQAISFGVTHELAQFILTHVLPAFSRAHPAVEITLMIETTTKLLAAVAQQDLDVAIGLKRNDPHDQGVLAEVPMIWLGGGGFALAPGASVPLGVCYRACPFRSAAIGALGQKRRFHIAALSSSFEGLSGPMRASMCVTVRTPYALEPDFVDIGERAGLPALPPIQFASYVSKAKQGAGAADLIEACRRALGRWGAAPIPSQHATFESPYRRASIADIALPAALSNWRNGPRMPAVRLSRGRPAEPNEQDSGAATRPLGIRLR